MSRVCRVGLWIGLSTMVGCASTTPGAKPHEMSTAHHEAAAQQEQQAAEEHQRQYNAKAASERTRCTNTRGAPGVDVDTGVCWTSVTNPTDIHLRAAEEHRRHAADHRAGSAALRAAEDQACVGIAPDDRDMSPFERTEDITSVAPYTVRISGGKTESAATLGAVVTFRAVPGMTAEWLQRLVDCHLARNASLGHVVPEMPNCPLVPNGVEAHVSSTGNGFAVVVQSSDRAVVPEIQARANRLVSHDASGSSR